jgi:glycosyltransferase involved in cell wall biosynthesis
MSDASRYEYCIFFTKDFPYGIHENYIFNELPHLAKTFKKVLIIPHEEFNYRPKENRLPEGYHNVEVVQINRALPEASRWQRVHWVQIALSIVLKEVIRSREPGRHLRSFRHLFGQLRHLAHAAYALKLITDKQGLSAENTVVYHYWFHRGMVIAPIFNRYFAERPFRNVSRAHSLDLYHKDWNSIYRGEPLFLPFEQWRWRNVDHVYTITEHGLQHIRKLFPQYASKVSVARLGVPDHGYLPRDMSIGAKVIITCSLLNGNKRLFLLPSILRHLSVAVDWYHFGHGSDEAKKEIEQLCAACPNHVTIHFMGLVPNARIQAFYKEKNVDLIVNLSEAEGLPVALMEAASFGVPMLATATVGNPEIVTDDNGLLIPVNFEAAQAGEKLEALFTHSDLWRKKSASARSTFEAHFQADVNYSNFFSLISQKKALN